MLRRANFWKEEEEAPILRLNRSFLPSEEILQRIEDTDEKDLPVNFDHERIIRLDSDRTFLGIDQRTTLMNVLSFLRNDFGSYHQAMSYVAGFLLLTKSPSKVIEIMRQIHRTVLSGYWTEEPIAFATDAYVFDYLLADFDPEVHTHLSKHFVFPETYVQKWFTTLSIAVLPFKALFLFFDTYLLQSSPATSNVFLFQFALNLIKHIREGILQAKNVSVIYQYLRLDSSLPDLAMKIDELAIAIVEGAKDYDLTSYDFVKLREKAFEEKLRKRLEAAKQVHQDNEDDQVICISSSENDESEEETSLATKIKTLVYQMKQLHIK